MIITKFATIYIYRNRNLPSTSLHDLKQRGPKIIKIPKIPKPPAPSRFRVLALVCWYGLKAIGLLRGFTQPGND